MTNSEKLFSRGVELMPGGVNSPVRGFGSVGGSPVFIKQGDGDRITDVDGKTYLDFVGSWGPMILGHNNPQILEAVIKASENGLSFGAPCSLEVELAELIVEMTGIEMLRMVNSGTEAVMSAVRLARGYTGKNKILKFEGCYHGHSDSMLIKSGSGVMTMGIPSSSGVSESVAAETLVAPYNNLEMVEKIFAKHENQIAAVIVEPVAANMGVVLPQTGFLEGLRKLTKANNSLLIFDEVITGFRLAQGGAQERFGITADLITYGKIIGGGMPVGAYGGRREIMEMIAPLGSVYQSGTLSGNPVAMAAGIAQLKQLKGNPEIYNKLESLTKKLAAGLNQIAKENDLPIQTNQIGSLCCCFFAENPVYDFTSANCSNTEKYAVYFKEMLANGIYLAPSQFEAMFVSAAHSEESIAEMLESAKVVLTQRLRR